MRQWLSRVGGAAAAADLSACAPLASHRLLQGTLLLSDNAVSAIIAARDAAQRAGDGRKEHCARLHTSTNATALKIIAGVDYDILWSNFLRLM